MNLTAYTRRMLTTTTVYGYAEIVRVLNINTH